MSCPKILVVDDDAFIRRPLEFILREEGFDPRIAMDGDEGLAKISEDPPDLIILDLMMPGRDGFDVCRTVKSNPKHADIPIILLSARGSEQDRDRGLSLGAADFMTKPYSRSELLGKIRELLQTSSDEGEEYGAERREPTG